MKKMKGKLFFVLCLTAIFGLGWTADKKSAAPPKPAASGAGQENLGSVEVTGEAKDKVTIQKWVPEIKDVQVQTAEGMHKPARPPTVKDCMLHCAGYTYGGGGKPTEKAYREKKPLEAKDLDDFAQRLASVPLTFDPGKDWIYGIGIDVVGLVVERASGMKLDRFLEERIFKPLDMKDTGFFVPACFMPWMMRPGMAPT